MEFDNVLAAECDMPYVPHSITLIQSSDRYWIAKSIPIAVINDNVASYVGLNARRCVVM